MRRILSVLLLMSASLAMYARIPVQRNIICSAADYESVRASLILNQGWVPYPSYYDRAGWDRFMGENKERIIHEGEKYLDYEWRVVKAMDYLEFERSGNRAVMENPLTSNNMAVSSLFAAELAEGQGRFLPQIVNGVFHTCEMTSWSLSAHLAQLSWSRRSVPQKGDNTMELTQGNMSQLLSWVYYFLAGEMDKIQPEFSRRLKDELFYRELDSFLARDDFWWMGNIQGRMLNNWTPWCASNALLCFMLMETDPDRLARAVWKSMQITDRYLNYIQGDGGIEEGPSYWGHASGKLFDYLNALDMITGGKVNVFDNDLVRNMGEYIVKSYVGDGWVVNFADASARGGANSLNLIYRYGKSVGSSLMMGFAASRMKEHPNVPRADVDISRFFEDLRYLEELKNADGSWSAESYSWYPETEFHYMSNGEGVFFAAKGGNNDESHNHNDVGTFNLYYDNYPVIIDVGVGTYTRQTFSDERYSIWTMQSSYHNLPRINGYPESYGEGYRSSNVVSQADRFSLDISGAYPEEAKVKKWERSYRLSGKDLIISDEFVLSEKKAPNEIVFMTWGDVAVTKPGVITASSHDRTFELKYSSKMFEVRIEPVSLLDPKLSGVWGEEIKRIIFVSRQEQSKGKYQFVISKK